jgi:octaprenyl-diphosphate synthase
MSPQVARATLPAIQRPVEAELERVAGELGRIVAADFPRIGEVNAHLLRMKGKLFRPTLLLLAHRATGGAADDPRAITLAAVVELIHLATLVHDDSVDHSVLRRGMPTINALFSHQTAVIMGDYLYSRAIIELVRLGELEPLQVLARVTNEMTIGEMRQLESVDRLAFNEADYDLLIRAKTASLVCGACEVGALRAPPAQREAARRFGLALGMAFQITDDVIDYTQTEAVTGKPTGLDLKEHKVTLPLIAALADGRLTAADRGRVEALMNTAAPTDAQVEEVVRLAEAAGGIAYAQRRALALARSAEAELEGLPPSPARDALRDAIAYAVERDR